MALLIKHSLKTILLGYLYEMQMFINGFEPTYIQTGLKDTWKSTVFPDNTLQNDTGIYRNMMNFQLLWQQQI